MNKTNWKVYVLGALFVALAYEACHAGELSHRQEHEGLLHLVEPVVVAPSGLASLGIDEALGCDESSPLPQRWEWPRNVASSGLAASLMLSPGFVEAPVGERRGLPGATQLIAAPHHQGHGPTLPPLLQAGQPLSEARRFEVRERVGDESPPDCAK